MRGGIKRENGAENRSFLPDSVVPAKKMSEI